MQLPSLLFTDYIPSTLTWSMTGGVSAGGSPAYEFWPYEHVMAGGIQTSSDATVSSISQHSMTGGVTAGGDMAPLFISPATYTWDMCAGMKAGASVYVDGVFMLGLAAGSATTYQLVDAPIYLPTGGVVFGGAATLPVRYDVSVDDAMPTGGVQFTGGATVKEAISFVPTSGVFFGGSAAIMEFIPVIPAGGAVFGGGAVEATGFAIVPTGGAIFSGVAPIVLVYPVPAPTGGVTFDGSSPVSTYVGLHVPDGGVEFGGSSTVAVAYLNYPTTTENPLGLPYHGWSVNAETGAVSRYMRLPANSMCQFNGKTFVANAGGIYEYGAANDAGQPIRASVEFPESDFGNSKTKRMEVAYFGVRTTSKLRLKVMVNGQDPQYYSLNPVSSTAKGVRVPIGKGLAGRYWSSRLDNVAGGDFELDSAEFVPASSQRRHGA